MKFGKKPVERPAPKGNFVSPTVEVKGEIVSEVREPQPVANHVTGICRGCLNEVTLFDDGSYRSQYRTYQLTGQEYKWSDRCYGDSVHKVLTDDELDDIRTEFAARVKALPKFSGYPAKCPACGFEHIPTTLPDGGCPRNSHVLGGEQSWMKRTCLGCKTDWYEQTAERTALPSTFVRPY